MAKYLFLGINSLLVLLINFFTGDDIIIKHNLPKSAAAGSEFIAEVTIAKGPANQFGKIQLDFPQGFTAAELDSKDGKFEFSNNQAKILWILLPPESEFTVKMKISVGKDVSGPKTITGKFLYVTGNEKKQTEMPPHEISVSSEAQTAATATTTATTTTTTQPKDTVSFNKPEEPDADVAVERKITKDEPSGNFRVNIKIKKAQIKGFAKYHDVLPEGLTASKGEISGGGSFKFADGKATIIWATLPKDEVITASYTIKVTGTFTENPKIKGVFSYLENEQSQKVNATEETLPIISTETTVATSTVVTTTTVAPTTTVTETTNTVVATSTVVPTTTVTETGTVTPTGTVSPTTTVSTTETKTTVLAGNVNYHIQIGAYKNPPQTSYFVSKFNISESISTDMHDGLTKFLIGKFNEYKESRDFRENVKGRGVTDAFVTAYNDGKRITVQEGLMITKQKWFR